MRRTLFSEVKDTKFYASILHIKIETSSIKSLNCFLMFVVKYFHVAPFFMQRRAVWMALNFPSMPYTLPRRVFLFFSSLYDEFLSLHFWKIFFLIFAFKSVYNFFLIFFNIQKSNESASRKPKEREVI